MPGSRTQNLNTRSILPTKLSRFFLSIVPNEFTNFTGKQRLEEFSPTILRFELILSFEHASAQRSRTRPLHLYRFTRGQKENEKKRNTPLYVFHYVASIGWKSAESRLARPIAYLFI